MEFFFLFVLFFTVGEVRRVSVSQSEDRARLALSASGTRSTGHVTLRGSGSVRDAVSPWHFYFFIFFCCCLSTFFP